MTGSNAGRRRRWWLPVLAVGLVVLGAGGFLWWDARQTHEISVDRAVEAFRSGQPTASPVGQGPEPGVYVYATDGSERVSAGVTHTYPAQTTLTVTPAGCGLQVRWDALEERWTQWQLCASTEGWRLDSVVDLHKFLHVADRQELDCGDDAVLRAPTSFTCRGDGVEQTWQLTPAGTEELQVGTDTVPAEHVRASTRTTGSSTNDGTVELWLRPDTGLPLRVVVRNSGAQHVLGSRVTYDEEATFELTSLAPQR